MNEADQIIVKFSKLLMANPARLLPVLAFASVVTLMIALMKDAVHRSRALHEKKLAPANPRNAETTRR